MHDIMTSGNYIFSPWFNCTETFAYIFSEIWKFHKPEKQKTSKTWKHMKHEKWLKCFLLENFDTNVGLLIFGTKILILKCNIEFILWIKCENVKIKPKYFKKVFSKVTWDSHTFENIFYWFCDLVYFIWQNVGGLKF